MASVSALDALKACHEFKTQSFDRQREDLSSPKSDNIK